MSKSIAIIGAGLAGSEAAWQLSERGHDVTLIDMRPIKTSPAHHSSKPAELVCSNSFRSADTNNAVGLLKAEMAALDSLIIKGAYHSRVPAGSALAVDRNVFSDFIHDKLSSVPNLKRVCGVVASLDSCGEQIRINWDESCDDPNRNHPSLFDHVIIATGPLTDDPLARWIQSQTGQDQLYFYDAIAPIIEKESVDLTQAFWADRWDKGDGEGDYLNCPMNEEQYEKFIDELLAAEKAEFKDFDQAQFFQGCQPIEAMAAQGRRTLAFGPMKPVGLRDKRSPETKFHAVVQLRQDNLHGSLMNMVGFQTRMKWGEQKRLFKMIPGLENAEFVRMGSMHRNTYLCSPILLKTGMELKNFPRVHFAGQITGCEGYVESAAVGLYVALVLDYHLSSSKTSWQDPPQTTALGALVHHILNADPKNYQPMNINFGLFPPVIGRMKKAERKKAHAARGAEHFHSWLCEKNLSKSA